MSGREGPRTLTLSSFLGPVLNAGDGMLRTGARCCIFSR
jgi:hypothetical protein